MMITTAIFDMDGLLIDSEPMWKLAEKTVFGALGVPVSDELAIQTASMTTAEVTSFWFTQHPWKNKSLKEVEQDVINHVEMQINQHGQALSGVNKTLQLLSQNSVKIGLATNSPHRLIDVILTKLNIAHFFSVISSAEHELSGKPDPAVYLTTLKKLNAKPEQCIAFEDSYSGLKAAQTAGISVISVPAQHEYHHPKFNDASLKLNCLSEFSISHIKHL
jgi:sugar-phosphatase